MDSVDTNVLGPIVGYAQEPLLPLAEACAPLVTILHDIVTYVSIALKSTSYNPSDHLTHDEAASIYLYTIKWDGEHRSLSSSLNDTLLIADRQVLIPWFKYLKLLLTALVKIPCAPPQTVWGGVRRNISDESSPKALATCWTFLSCTTSCTVLESELYLGNTGARTLFSIELINGRNIRAYSQSDTEDNILVLPGTHMEVQSHLNATSDLHIIYLKQKIPNEVLLEPPFKGACLYPKTEQHWYCRTRFIVPVCLLTAAVFVTVIVSCVLEFRSVTNTPASNSIYSAVVTSNYSSALTNSSHMFARNGVSTMYYYEAIQVTASISSNYNFTSVSVVGTYGYLYLNSFNSFNVSDNLLTQSDDTGGNTQFQIEYVLQPGITYILVVTTSRARITAAFSIVVSGPARINLFRLNIMTTPSSTNMETTTTIQITYSNGDQYQGNVKDGKKEGYGTCYYADGDIYAGNWVNNTNTGYGVYTWFNGDRYEGTLEQGIPDGYGTYYLIDGDIYTGDVVNNSFNGYGVYRRLDGSRVEGNWKENHLYGWAKKIDPYGQTQQFYWMNDTLIA